MNQKTKIKSIMKQVAIALFVVSFLAACGSNSSTETTPTDSTSVTTTDTTSVVADSVVVDTTTVK